jgi:hypothetical protein
MPVLKYSILLGLVLIFSCKRADNTLPRNNVVSPIDSSSIGIDISESLTIAIDLNNKLGSLCSRVGSISDINKYYPFNSIKLCNVSSSSSGNPRITYADNPSFNREGDNGEVMVEIPKIYLRRIIRDGQEYISISKKKKEGFVLDPAFIENNIELEHIYISAYAGVVKNGKLRSITSEKANSNFSLNDYRSYAKNNGKGFGLIDARSLFLLQRLFMIYYADRNSQAAVGSGITNLFWQSQAATLAKETSSASNKITVDLRANPDRYFMIKQYCAVAPLGEYSLSELRVVSEVKTLRSGYTEISFSGNPVNIQAGISRIYGQVQKNGLTDNIISPNGSSQYFGGKPSMGTEAVKFLNIENLWGNVWYFIDGFFIKDLQPYIGENMDDYASTTPEQTFTKLNYKLPLQNSNKQDKEEENQVYIAQLGLDESHPAYSLPIKIGATASSNLGYCDPFYSRDDDGSRFYAACGGGFDHAFRAGLFTTRIWFRSNQSVPNLYGSRIQFKKY